MKSGIQESKNPVFDFSWFPGFLIKNHPSRIGVGEIPPGSDIAKRGRAF
jgi:hypothetical protein